MNSGLIIPVLKKLATQIAHRAGLDDLEDPFSQVIELDDNAEHFLSLATEKAHKIDLGFLINRFKPNDFIKSITSMEYPVLSFVRLNSKTMPVVFDYTKREGFEAYVFEDKVGYMVIEKDIEELFNSLILDQRGNCLVAIPVSIVPQVSKFVDGQPQPLTPVKRLFRVLSGETKEITLIYFYAVLITLISLVLPLGVQSIIELVSGGVVVNSIVLLISFVIVSIVVSGFLQVMQFGIVEVLQRRVFVKAAIEFSVRIPRFKAESILDIFPPEIINRFFDVLSLQKGLPKLLMDLTASVFQIFFGVLLLSFYHPFFVFFGIFLILTLSAIIYFTSPPALKAALIESKYKYKAVHWLEEIARTVFTFKLAGHTNLPMQKMNTFINSYLYYRKKSFQILVTQYTSVIAFKTLVTGGLLIIGSYLVVDRQINLGQFVATEIVIILIISAVEKLMVTISTVYDVLTAVEKIAQVTDIEVERQGGVYMPSNGSQGMEIKATNLSYTYPGSTDPVLKNINLVIRPKESICITGYGGSGKHTFIKLLSGILSSYEGSLTMDNISLRDVNLASLRDIVAYNGEATDLFEGTILENLTVGNEHVTYKDAIWALEAVGLYDMVNGFADGLNTTLVASGMDFSTSVATRLVLARSIAERPKLLIMNDIFNNLEKDLKLKLISFLLDQQHPWNFICVSNDPLLMASCDRVVVFKDGEIVGEGPYIKLVQEKNPYINEIL
jgi:ABC-type bacteriocin/lantibiotic exporter with double-glycine peptidase domain